MSPPASWITRRRRLLTAIAVVLWVLAFTATHIPPSDLGHIAVSHRVLHVTGYAGLTFWIGLALIATGAPPRRRVVGIALVLAAYGVFDELTQPIFGRTASIRDWLADLVGIAVGLATAELTALIALRRAAAQRKR